MRNPRFGAESRLIERLDRKRERDPLAELRKLGEAIREREGLEPRLQLSPYAFERIREFLRELAVFKDGHASIELNTPQRQKSACFLREWRVLYVRYDRDRVSAELRFQIKVVESLLGLENRNTFEQALRIHRRERERVAPRNHPA